MSSVRYNNLLFDICEKLDELHSIKRLRFMCREKIAEGSEDSIINTRALFLELEKQGHLGIDCLDDLRELLKELGEWELLRKVLEFESAREEVKKLEEERVRMEGKATRVLSSAKRAGEKVLGAINLHCNFRTIGGGVVVVGAVVILHKCSTLPEFMDAFTKVVLPAATKLCAITEGSVCFTVQAENLPALQMVWQQYQDGTLQKNLQDFLITEEINQLADGQEVMVNVNIVEQEYREACLELMTAEMKVFDEEPPLLRRQRESDSMQVFEKEPPLPWRQRESDSIQVFDKEPPRPRRQRESDSIQVFDKEPPLPRRQKESDSIQVSLTGVQSGEHVSSPSGTASQPQYAGVQSGEHVSSPSGTASQPQYAVTGVQSDERVSSASETASLPQYAVTGVQSGEHIASSPSGTASLPQYAGTASQPQYAVFEKEPLLLRRQRESDSIQVFDEEPPLPVRQRESDSIQVFDKEPPRPRRQKESDSIQGPSSDPSRSVAERKGLKEAEAGRESNFTINTRNSEEKHFSQADDHVTVKIPTPKDEEMEKKIDDKKDERKYTASNTPDSVGQHETAINVNDQPLTDSPWSVQVTPHRYVTESIFGSRGKGKGQFRWPQGIAVSEKTGNIAVADSDNNRIQIFSSEKKYLRKFGQKWIGADILSHPRSVAFTRSGDLIVAHVGNMCVLTEDAQFFKHVINEHLKSPWSVSVGRDGHLIVCDFDDKTIKLLSPDGTELLQSFRDPDCDESAWFAVYHHDAFFVSYFSAHCVKVFNKEGEFLYNIGSEGSGDGQLNHPRGLAVDKFNNLIVCDRGNGRLQVFTLDGQFVSKTDQHTARMMRPSSVAVSQDGHVFVTDGSTNSVHVLK